MKDYTAEWYLELEDKLYSLKEEVFWLRVGLVSLICCWILIG